ncbi:hypothetical protein VTL71DRAFT_13277 [Oculimacula yallundae]|uniref:Uncharacterized protein n=1 Tax=Oculimacula yallundae TaxID=86028 RepID=A0ABR4CLD8_9HELO
MKFTMVLPHVLSVLFLVAEVRARCYGSGVSFNGLHGGDQDKTDLSNEVRADINSRCMEVAGRTISKENPFWKCTEWAKTANPTEGCFDACLDKCEPDPGSSGTEAALCAALNCHKDCDKGPPVAEFNRIEWAIEVRGNDGPKEITYEKCIEWFNWEFGGCHLGGENSHDGFWFRIDPNYGKCS